MFDLAVPTPKTWAAAMVPQIDELLIEQAHLEKKAAAAALGFLFRYPDVVDWQQPLSELAREELSHFEAVLAWLRRRGVAFRRQRPSHYASALRTFVRGHEPERRLDDLLCAAVIEARSCERMRLLAAALAPSEPELAAFYRGLVAAEARHHALYVQLAQAEFAGDVVQARLAACIAHEAQVVLAAGDAAHAPRLHA